jgi:hypothetical protein
VLRLHFQALAAVISLAGIVATRPAAAQDGTAVALDYRVAGGCPNEASFVAEVRARTASFRVIAGAARRFTLTVAQEAGGGAGGSLVIETGNGEPTTREVRGDTCAEVVSALALVTALAVDASPPPAAQPEAASPVAERRPATGAQIGVGAGGGAISGSAPDAAFALHAFAEVRAARPGLWSPTIRGTFERSLERSAAIAGVGTAGFTLTMGELDLCPSRWGKGALSLVGCARAELGVLRGEGRDIVPAREQSRTWIAADGLARGAVTVAGPLSLEVAAGVRVPLLHTRYIFQPNATVFRAPAIGVLADVDAVVHFP